MKKCCRCHQTKPLNAFYPHRSKKDGYNTMCIECCKAYNASRRPTASVTEKECATCHQVKPITEFYCNKRLPDGHHRQCKHCEATKDFERGTNGAYIKTYRKRWQNPKYRADTKRRSDEWKKTNQRKTRPEDAVHSAI